MRWGSPAHCCRRIPPGCGRACRDLHPFISTRLGGPPGLPVVTCSRKCVPAGGGESFSNPGMLILAMGGLCLGQAMQVSVCTRVCKSLGFQGYTCTQGASWKGPSRIMVVTVCVGAQQAPHIPHCALVTAPVLQMRQLKPQRLACLPTQERAGLGSEPVSLGPGVCTLHALALLGLSGPGSDHWSCGAGRASGRAPAWFSLSSAWTSRLARTPRCPRPDSPVPTRGGRSTDCCCHAHCPHQAPLAGRGPWHKPKFHLLVPISPPPSPGAGMGQGLLGPVPSEEVGCWLLPPGSPRVRGSAGAPPWGGSRSALTQGAGGGGGFCREVSHPLLLLQLNRSPWGGTGTGEKTDPCFSNTASPTCPPGLLRPRFSSILADAVQRLSVGRGWSWDLPAHQEWGWCPPTPPSTVHPGPPLPM